jgi:hypothetical protein
VENLTRETRQLGYGAIVFYGHPDYHPRFGFRSAKAFDRTSPHREPVSMIPIDVTTNNLEPEGRKSSSAAVFWPAAMSQPRSLSNQV